MIPQLADNGTELEVAAQHTMDGLAFLAAAYAPDEADGLPIAAVSPVFDPPHSALTSAKAQQ